MAPEKDSLRNIDSPMSQSEQDVDFDVAASQDQTIFQKIDKQDRKNTTQQGFKNSRK